MIKIKHRFHRADRIPVGSVEHVRDAGIHASDYRCLWLFHGTSVSPSNTKIPILYTHENRSCHFIAFDLMQRMSAGVQRNDETFIPVEWVCNRNDVRSFYIR